MSLLKTVLEVTGFLEEAKIEFLIGGSLASSAWGQERTTHDADIAVLLSESKFEALEQLVRWPYVMDSATIRSSLSNLHEFDAGQILHGETLDKIDLFLMSDNEYSRSQLQNRRYIDVVSGHPLPFASPEDTVITKLRWFLLGNRVSDRQWNDIVQVLEIQEGLLDEAYIDRWCEHFNLTSLLEDAKRQASGSSR